MLWIISSLVFILLRIAPGDPVDAILGIRANEFARESLRIRLGLDKPLINQYLEYLNNLIKVEQLAAEASSYLPIWLVSPKAWSLKDISQPEFSSDGLIILKNLKRE